MKIVFTKSKKKFAIFSKLLCWYQGTEYSHVALQVNNYFYQANEGKVNKEYKDHFLKEHKIIASYEIGGLLNLDIIEKQLGVNYSLAQNVGIVISDIFKKQIANPFTKGMNCSEFIYTFVIKQILPKLNKDADLIKPKHIEQILKDNGYGKD